MITMTDIREMIREIVKEVTDRFNKEIILKTAVLLSMDPTIVIIDIKEDHTDDWKKIENGYIKTKHSHFIYLSHLGLHG